MYMAQEEKWRWREWHQDGHPLPREENDRHHQGHGDKRRCGYGHGALETYNGNHKRIPTFNMQLHEAPLPEDLDCEAIRFSEMHQAHSGKRCYYPTQRMSFKATTIDAPLCVIGEVSQTGSTLESSFAVQIPVQSSSRTASQRTTHKFLERLNNDAVEQVRGHVAEMFPRMETDLLSDAAFNKAYIPFFDGGNGRLKLKVILPPKDEDRARLSPLELERHMRNVTKIIMVTDVTPGSFEVADGCITNLTVGRKIVPIVVVDRLWVNENNCGMTLRCSSIFVVASSD